MILSKAKLSLVLVGLLFFVGCSGGLDENNINEVSHEMSQTMVMEVDDEVEDIELIKKEGYYSISGVANYLDGTVVEINGEIKLIDDEGKNMISLQLDGLGWRKESSSVIEGLSMLEGVSRGLTKSIPHEELANYIVSQDGSKVAVINEDENTAKIHNLKSNKTTTVEDITISHIKKPYHENVIFSPNGGYISFQMVDEKNGEGFISYGADSGKKVHDLIYGINPSWSHEEQSILFTHRDSDKVGVFQRRSRSIKYLVELDQKTKIFSNPLWSKDDTTIYFTVGEEYPTMVQMVTIKDGSSVIVKEEKSSKRIGKTYLAHRQLVYSLMEKELNSGFMVADLDGRGTTNYEDVDSFHLMIGNEIQLRNFYPLEEGILYAKDQAFYLLKDYASQRILRSKGEVRKVQYLPELKLLAFYIDGETRQVVLLFLENLQ